MDIRQKMFEFVLIFFKVGVYEVLIFMPIDCEEFSLSWANQILSGQLEPANRISFLKGFFKIIYVTRLYDKDLLWRNIGFCLEFDFFGELRHQLNRMDLEELILPEEVLNELQMMSISIKWRDFYELVELLYWTG